MVTLILSIILSPLPGSGPGMGHAGPGYGVSSARTETTFYAPLDSNGFTDLDDPPGLPTPSMVWLGGDPTDDQKSAIDFTATGSTTDAETPFCSDGNFTDLTNCIHGRAWDGSGGDYYTADNISVMQPGNATDFSFCVIYQQQDHLAGTTSRIFTKRHSSGSPQISLNSPIAGTPTWTFSVTNAAASTVTVTSPAGTTSPGWMGACGTYDADGTMKIYNHLGGVTSDTAPGGDLTSDVALRIGTTTGAGSARGIIVGLWYWQGTVLTAGQVDDFLDRWFGIHENSNIEVVYDSQANTQHCWVEGKLETYAGDIPMIGCEVGPNLTGAGTPNAGYLYSPSKWDYYTLSSRTLDSNWTLVEGLVTSVLACNQATTPFRDGRTTCKLTDDDALVAEHITQTRTIAAVGTGDKINICIYATADSAQNIDIQMVEATGCAGSTTNFAAQAIDTSWKIYTFQHTIADGACTDFTLKVSPTSDITDILQTGHAYVMINSVTAASTSALIAGCPSYVETAGSTLTSGVNTISYALTGTQVLASTNLVANNIVTFDYVGHSSTVYGPTEIYGFYGATDQLYLYLEASAPEIDVNSWFVPPGATRWVKADVTLTAGTSYSFQNSINFLPASFNLTIGGASQHTSTTATTKGSYTTLYLMSPNNGYKMQTGGAMLRRFKIVREN